jgi:two-component system, NtrC family, response regulator AtoC
MAPALTRRLPLLMSARVLFVEDDDLTRELMLAVVKGHYEAEAVTDAEAAIVRASEVRFDVLVTDVRLPRMSGIDLIPRVTRLHPHMAVIVVSGEATIAMAVTAMKRGALDFLTKPFTPQSLRGLIQVAAARRPVSNTKPVRPGSAEPHPMVADSPAMRDVLSMIDAVAPYNTSVLVTGETGTGKELVARRLHAYSARADRPFVALNCAAVPEQLLEDELFGHVRGAFTGAQEARIGRFEQADGGTLLLDEVGDMSLPLQAKFLRVLQEREFERLGSGKTVKVDVRIVAATSADLERRINQGAFRPDLYYRLNVVRVDLPPLRARPGDIPILAESLLKRFCVEAGLPAKRLASAALTTLAAYDWPGNVRQLRNAMERAAAITGPAIEIHPDDLPEEIRRSRPTMAPPAQDGPPRDAPIDAVLRDFERGLLTDALERAGGNKVRAARLLGMKRTTFMARLRRVQASPDARLTASRPVSAPSEPLEP